MGALQKYSPPTFSDYIGERVKKIALRKVKRRLATQEEILVNSSLEKQYEPMRVLLKGIQGCGKTSCARLLAKAHFCTEGKDGGPCGVCETCRRFEAWYDRNRIDFTLPPSRTPSTAHHDSCYLLVFDFTNLSAGTVPRLLQEIAQPKEGMFFRSHPEVVIIDEIHRAPLEVQNKLLTTLGGNLFSSVIVCATKKGRERMDLGLLRRFDEIAVTSEIGEVLSFAKNFTFKESIPIAEESALVKLVSGMKCNPGFVIKALVEAQDAEEKVTEEWAIGKVAEYGPDLEEDDDALV